MNTRGLDDLIANAESIEAYQRRLVEAGYDLSIRDRNGRAISDGIDGQWGPITQVAHEDYLRRLAEQPLPPKPWWASRRMIGLLVAAIGLSAGVAGYDIDQAALTELLTALVSFAGLAVAFIGSIKATRPVDPGAIAPGVHLPRRVREPARLSAGSDTTNQTRRGGFPTGPFFPDR